jgi:hypothetical protein
MRKEVHVVSNPKRGGWDVKKPDLTRSSGHFNTKQDAMKFAHDQAFQQHRELIPHGKDGKIQNPSSFGGDPCPPKDQR